MILRQKVTSTDGYFPWSIKYGIFNQDNPSNNPYSIINALNPGDWLNNNGTYKFRLIYNDGGKLSDRVRTFDKIWTQKSWLTESSIVGTSLVDPSGCNGAYFSGLAISGDSSTFLDGNGGESCWYGAVGMIANSWSGAMPVMDGLTATSDKLYICDGLDCDKNLFFASPKKS